MRKWFVFCLMIILVSLQVTVVNAQEGEYNGPVVHAVLFYSPTCPHCHVVIDEVITPMMEELGEKLQVIGINTSTPQGSEMFSATHAFYKVPPNMQGVPTLLVGEIILVGSGDIPARFPGIVSEGLEGEGIDWPAEPNIRELLAIHGLIEKQPGQNPGDEQSLSQSSPTPGETTGESTEEQAAILPAEQAEQPESNLQPPPVAETDPGAESAQGEAGENKVEIVASDLTAGIAADPARTPMENFAQDPVGNSLALVILIIMVISVVLVIYAFVNRTKLRSYPNWAIPVLVLIGIFVAMYLSYIESTNSTAFCGPVGDCNAVQQSEFATLFGFLPVGVLGLLGYIGIGVAWFVQNIGSESFKNYGALAIWAFALIGTLFSIYLTFLEPFVIGATCMWCVTSAIIMTLLLWGTTSSASRSYRAIKS